MSKESEPRKWIKADLAPGDIAHYLADTIRDLVPLARQAEFRDLAYLLGLALAEAEVQAKPGNGTASR